MIAYSHSNSVLERLPHRAVRQFWQCTPCCTERPCFGDIHHLIAALTLHLSFPAEEEDSMVQLSTRYVSNLVQQGKRLFCRAALDWKPLFLASAPAIFDSHFLRSSSSISVKAPKESQSDKVACYEVATFWTEAFDREDRFAERVLKVVLFFCLGLFDCH